MDDTAVQEFWEYARVAAKLNPLAEIFGPRQDGTVPPTVWSFGDDPETADVRAELVVRGVKTASSGPAWEYERTGAPLPEEGQLTILADSAGHPRALLRTTSVRVVPFAEVDADHADAEGEGDGSLEWWREEHRHFFASLEESGVPFDESMPVVLERFEVLYPVR